MTSPTSIPTAAAGPSGSTRDDERALVVGDHLARPTTAATRAGLVGGSIAPTLATLTSSGPSAPWLQMPTSRPSALTTGAPSGVDSPHASSVRWPSVVDADVGRRRCRAEHRDHVAGACGRADAVRLGHAPRHRQTGTANPRSRSTIRTVASCGWPSASCRVMTECALHCPGSGDDRASRRCRLRPERRSTSCGSLGGLGVGAGSSDVVVVVVTILGSLRDVGRDWPEAWSAAAVRRPMSRPACSGRTVVTVLVQARLAVLASTVGRSDDRLGRPMAASPTARRATAARRSRRW